MILHHRLVQAARLRELGFRSYDDYLDSAHWRDVQGRYGGRPCEVCGKRSPTGLHHKNYGCLGRETAADLVSLCPSCHSSVHAAAERDGLSLSAAVSHVRTTRIGEQALRGLIRERRVRSRSRPVGLLEEALRRGFDR